MPTPERLHGVVPAIPTPFTADGREVDEAALRRIVRHVVDGGVRQAEPSAILDLTSDEARFIREGDFFFTQKVWKTLRKTARKSQ